jgi:hypothetical protein
MNSNNWREVLGWREKTHPDYPVQEIKFNQIPNIEGIVLLGTGGDIDEWIKGVTEGLNEENIAQGTPMDLWNGFYLLSTTGGRKDLVLPFKEGAKIDMSKLSTWRLQFGDCSWISDYKVNYRKQH